MKLTISTIVDAESYPTVRISAQRLAILVNAHCLISAPKRYYFDVYTYLLSLVSFWIFFYFKYWVKCVGYNFFRMKYYSVRVFHTAGKSNYSERRCFCVLSYNSIIQRVCPVLKIFKLGCEGNKLENIVNSIMIFTSESIFLEAFLVETCSDVV